MSPERVTIELSLSLGTVERRVSLEGLAGVLGLSPTLVSQGLRGFLCGYPQSVDNSTVGRGERGTIGGEGPVLSSETNERTIQSITSTTPIADSTKCVTKTFVEGEGGCREEEGPRGDEELSTARLATYLADRLDDPGSLTFYASVVRQVPRQVIREALVAALDLSPHEVRRSRAAYFTAIVRPHLARHPHAHA